MRFCRTVPLSNHPCSPSRVRRILRLRPCRRHLWQLRASWLLAWWLGNILIGLVACWLVVLCCLAFVLMVFSVGMCAGSPMPRFWHLLLPLYSPRQLRTALRLSVLIRLVAYWFVGFPLFSFYFMEFLCCNVADSFAS